MLCIIPWYLAFRWRGGGGGDKRKTPVRKVKKCQLDGIHYVDMTTVRQVVPTSLLTPVFLGMLGTPGPTLGQCRYLPSCQIKWFQTPANLESHL
jgi:hypothetical protein